MGIKDVLNKFKQFLSAPVTGILVLLLAMAGRIIQVLFFFNIRSDRAFQLLASDSLLDGHGISTAHVFSHDLSTVVYEPLIKWPPGYSLLMAPFYSLFGRDYIAAGLTLDILSAIAFILLCRALVKTLDLPLYLVNAVTLLAGFFIYGFYFISSSDAIAVTLFLAGLYPTVLLLKRRKAGMRYGAWIGITLFACALFKYLFLMAVFMPPALLILKGLLDRKPELRKGGYVSLFLLSVGLGVLFLYQEAVGTNAEYISDVQSGLYPENLLSAYPFLPASLIKPDTVMKLFGFDWSSEATLVQLFQVIHLLLLVVLIVAVVRVTYMQGVKNVPLTEGFFYLCFFTSLAVVALLALLSVRYGKSEEMPGFWWTYIQEPRYYGLPNVLLHLALFVLYYYGRLKQSTAVRFTAGVLLLVLFVELVRGGVFVANRVTKWGREEYSWQYEDRFQKYAAGIIDKARKERGLSKVVVTSPFYYYQNRVALYSHIPVLKDASKINNLSSIYTKEPVLLLVMLHEKHLTQFQPFLSQVEKEPAGNFDGYLFYTVYVEPR